MSKEKKELERRSYDCEVRAEDRDNGESIITGRPIVYNSPTDLGWFTEIVDAGALDNTDLTDVRLLVNHDTSRIPLARSRRNNGNSTMQLSPNTFGLDFMARIDTESNEQAKALRSAIDRGDISGMSYMFLVRGERWDDLDSEHPTRHITDIASVIEISAVTFPAYDATEIHARNAKALENAKIALEKARAEARALKPVDTGNREKLKLQIQILRGKK